MHQLKYWFPKLLTLSVLGLMTRCDFMFCKDSKPQITHIPFTTDFDKVHPFDYQEADFGISNFCTLKTVENETEFLKKVDSIVVNYIENVPRDKYKYIIFMFFEDWVIDDFKDFHMYDHPIRQRYPEAYLFKVTVNFHDVNYGHKLSYKLSNEKLKYLYRERGVGTVAYRKPPLGLLSSDFAKTDKKKAEKIH